MKVKRMNNLKFVICAVAGMMVFSSVNNQVQAAGWGTITGQIVFEGDAPSLEMVVKKGDKSAKDAAVCAVDGVPNESLVVDSDTNGISHIFIYMTKSKKIHPDLKKSEKKELVFDQKGCKFIPHTLVARTDQVVNVISSDNCSHNFHSFPFKNNAVNKIMKPNDKEGIMVKNRKSEKLPVQVKCDIHPWMQAYWLVLDHPYGTATDSNGKFEIKDIPAGKQKFRVWQEKAGYVSLDSDNAKKSKRGFDIVIKDGETIDLGVIKVTASDFK